MMINNGIWAYIPAPISFIFGIPVLSMILFTCGISLGFRKLYVWCINYVILKANAVNTTTRKEQVAVRRRTSLFRNKSYGSLTKTFHLSDVCDFMVQGVQSIISDEVTTSFVKEELPEWNLMSRSTEQFAGQKFRKRYYFIWILGVILRYVILLPIRFFFGLFGVFFFTFSFSLLTLLPQTGKVRKILERQFSFFTARMFVLSWSAVIKYHDVHNRPKSGICVANHTSPIDCIVLANDNCYSMVGQRHGGFIGLLQDTLSIAQKHIWFDRAAASDRNHVVKTLKKHTENKDNNPILIFPEGTCINNTSVMMFKKGGFEVGATVYPVAIKYNPMFSDCFWNSSTQNFLQHIMELMTSWAVVADVWYLPPEDIRPGESSIAFASRVKKLISDTGGLTDLQWDGQLKRKRVKSTFKQDIQKQYSSWISLQDINEEIKEKENVENNAENDSKGSVSGSESDDNGLVMKKDKKPKSSLWDGDKENVADGTENEKESKKEK
eukprot:Nk52_evm49s62 gene=Nk52_evmTU49s62